MFLELPWVRDGIVDENYMSDPVLHGSILRTCSRGLETR